MRNSRLVALCFICAFASTKVQAAFENDELSYEDLVNELSHKQEDARNKKPTTSPIKSHLSLGIVNTWTQVSSNAHNYNTALNGFEVSTGVDINSDKIRGEVGLRNFFDKNTATQSASLQELGGVLSFRRELDSIWRSKFIGGFAIRHLRFEDVSSRTSVDDTSSMLMGGAGIEVRLSKDVSFGGELSTRLPFGTVTSDRSSLDFGLKLDTSF